MLLWTYDHTIQKVGSIAGSCGGIQELSNTVDAEIPARLKESDMPLLQMSTVGNKRRKER